MTFIDTEEQIVILVDDGCSLYESLSARPEQ